MNASLIKRIGAYIIDFIIILIISNVINTVLPNNKEVVKLTNEGTTIISNYFESVNLDDKEKLNEYNMKLNDYNYRLSKASILSTLVTIVLYFLYFVVFQSYNNGQTVGKKIMKIQILGNNNQKASFKQLLIRSIILFPIIFNLVGVIALVFLKQNTYQNVSSVLSLVHYSLFIACFISVAFSDRGMHDRLAGTCVYVFGTTEEVKESKASKWKKTSDKEKEIKKYVGTHTRGKRKEEKK